MKTQISKQNIGPVAARLFEDFSENVKAEILSDAHAAQADFIPDQSLQGRTFRIRGRGASALRLDAKLSEDNQRVEYAYSKPVFGGTQTQAIDCGVFIIDGRETLMHDRKAFSFEEATDFLLNRILYVS